MKNLVIVLALCALLLAPVAAVAGELGVYINVVKGVEGGFDDAVAAVKSAVEGAGWSVLTDYESGVEQRCGLRAHNIVIFNAGYASAIIAQGPTAGFALPLRVSIFEDKDGINAAILNPASINRTVLGDGILADLGAQTAKTLADAIGSALNGKRVDAQIGQIRDKGYVGGMGGGNFDKKIDVIHKGAGDVADTVEKIKGGIAAGKDGWRLVYGVEVGGVAILGLANPATEAKAFDIAGDSRESKSYKCPGLDHASAFPIEVIVYANNGNIEVAILDEMYRMKVYFEDAGNWAFMKNASMPFKIQGEVESAVLGLLKK